MKLTGNKIFSFMWAAAFALTLAGCGGGGGGGGASDDTMTTPSVPDQAIMAAKAAAAATAALNAAKEAVDGAGADQDYDAVHYALATTELGKAADAKAAADAANAEAQAADTVEAAEAARDDALAAQAAAEAAQADAEMFAKAVADAKKAAPPASSDQAEFEARLALADAKTATAGAVAAAGVAVTATKAAARAAAAAVTKAKKARTNAAGAEAAKKAADRAAKDAEAAKKTADAAKAAVAKLDDDGVGTRKGAADLESAADAAAGNAATAVGKANEAEAAAEKARDDAMAAADTHVLGLFKAANGDDITFVGSEDDADIASALGKAKSARREAVIEAIGTAAGARLGAAVDIKWPPADVAANSDATPPTEAVPGALSIEVTPTGGSEIPFRAEAVEDDLATDRDESMSKTATKIDGLRGFMHGYSVSDGGSHTIVFTDKEQSTPAIPAKTVTLDIVNQPVTASQVVLPDDATTLAGATYDHDGDPDTPGVTARFYCGSTIPSDCMSSIEDGKLTSLVGYVVDVFVSDFLLAAAKDGTDDNDYLAFGVWLRVGDDGDTGGEQPAVGAFVAGGEMFTVDEALTGDAMYNGAATGVYTAGSRVDYFQGSATLTADFGTKPEMGEDDMMGTITGRIHDIVAGGVSMRDVILLNADVTNADGTPVDNITEAGGFTGMARMGAPTVTGDVASHPYKGAWGGQFYGPVADDDAEGVDALPPAVAGVFGVTGATGEGDAAVTRSYVGAFGARR